MTSKYSPYSVDYSWSDEAKGLRELAVKSPWLITPDFIHKHFKTLRIVDKNVSLWKGTFLHLKAIIFLLKQFFETQFCPGVNTKEVFGSIFCTRGYCKLPRAHSQILVYSQAVAWLGPILIIKTMLCHCINITRLKCSGWPVQNSLLTNIDNLYSHK